MDDPCTELFTAIVEAHMVSKQDMQLRNAQ